MKGSPHMALGQWILEKNTFTNSYRENEREEIFVSVKNLKMSGKSRGKF